MHTHSSLVVEYCGGIGYFMCRQRVKGIFSEDLDSWCHNVELAKIVLLVIPGFALFIFVPFS
jgi:hypothetical protein